MNSLKEFVDYVASFYLPSHPEVLYPIQGLTERRIYDAFYVYKHRLLKASNNPNNNFTWGYGDSLDRERVRDILLETPWEDDLLEDSF